MRTRLAIVLVAVLSCLPAAAHAADDPQDLRTTAGDLKARAETTIDAVDDYFAKVPSTKGDAEEIAQFRGFARELRLAMVEVVAVATPLAASSATFNQRFETLDVRVADLVDLVSRGRFNRFIPLVDEAPACCDTLKKDVAPNEHAFAISLAESWKGFGARELEASIVDMTSVYKKFEAKLLKGFPGMPWEYVLNVHGNRSGPSAHQVIWAHPSLGFEVDDKSADGTSQVRPVLALQLVGYNHYFFKGLNYIGGAAILTINATEGRDRWRKGAAVHFGNVASVGVTHGDDRWILFVASDRLGDKLVGALVKLR